MKFLALILALTFSTTMVFAQNYSITPEKSEIKVLGTSNVHDWELNAEEFSGAANIEVEDGIIASVKDMQLTVVVNSLKSGKGGLDKKTYGALNEGKHKNIVFVITGVNEIRDNTIIATGDLTISGVTRSVNMEVSYEILPDGAVTFQGSQQLKMSDFNVSPPSAMFGAVKAGDDITVNFNTTFSRSANI